VDWPHLAEMIDASSPAEWTELMRDFRLSDYAELEWLGITSELIQAAVGDASFDSMGNG
jgi:hypothetical protein